MHAHQGVTASMRVGVFGGSSADQREGVSPGEVRTRVALRTGTSATTAASACRAPPQRAFAPSASIAACRSLSKTSRTPTSSSLSEAIRETMPPLMRSPSTQQRDGQIADCRRPSALLYRAECPRRCIFVSRPARTRRSRTDCFTSWCAANLSTRSFSPSARTGSTRSAASPRPIGRAHEQITGVRQTRLLARGAASRPGRASHGAHRERRRQQSRVSTTPWPTSI